MSPKSLLRHKDAVSSLDELVDGRFQNVIGEVEALPAKGVKRVIACSGKVYYELVAHRREHNIRDVAIIRIEQQYPFPHAEFRAALAQFPKAKEVVWCQEEPQNQGAWYRLVAYYRADSLPHQTVAYAGRPVSASTAVGYMSKHLAQQKQLIEDAFGPNLTMGQMLVATPMINRGT
jgi:2-oxoglutarate dehydrogenase E1 component